MHLYFAYPTPMGHLQQFADIQEKRLPARGRVYWRREKGEGGTGRLVCK